MNGVYYVGSNQYPHLTRLSSEPSGQEPSLSGSPFPILHGCSGLPCIAPRLSEMEAQQRHAAVLDGWGLEAQNDSERKWLASRNE